MRSEFEKTKTYGLCKSLQIDFDEDRKRYYSINPDLHVDVMSINSAFCMFQEQQPKVDELQKQRDSFIKAYEIEMDESVELQKRVDAAHDTLTELKEKSEALHHRWHIFNDSVALAEAGMIDMCVKELEQALKGE